MSSAIEILKSYDVIFSDVFGVIHDGIDILPNVRDTFSKLLELNKKVIFISNAPRRTSYLTEKFNTLGLGFLNEHIVSSGEFFRHEYLNKKLPIYNGKGFILGKETNPDLTTDLDFAETKILEEAKFMLILKYADGEPELNDSLEVLEKAAKLGLLAVCPNPDRIVNYGKNIRYTAGKFAELYEKLSGKVIYYGKPHKAIFEYASKKFHLSTATQKAIMIGDSLETDIKGAKLFNIDSLLLLTGITKKENLEELSLQPTYILNQL